MTRMDVKPEIKEPPKAPQASVVNPVCIILVKNGSKGDRLLFRYPYAAPAGRYLAEDGDDSRGGISNPLSVTLGVRSNSFSSRSQRLGADSDANDTLGDGNLRVRKMSRVTGIRSRSGSDANRSPYAATRLPFGDDMYNFAGPGKVVGGRNLRTGNAVLGELTDKDLSNLLAVNTDLSEQKFELKTNDIRFVGHPTLMHNPKDRRPQNPAYTTSVKLFHVVFCLQAMASHSIVKCYYDLSKRLGIGLRHEEYRCGYLSTEMKQIILKHDEACTEAHTDDILEQLAARESLFSDILATSSLAQLLKRVYDDVCQTGFIRVKINNWVQVSFCLPQKIHHLPFRPHTPLVEPEDIHRCLESIRPYHAILLLVDKEVLAKSFWIDSSSTIPRLLQVHSPIKSLQTLSADADLTMSQVVEIASHLVYWAAATVIYPICETNVYVIAPDAPVTSTELSQAFASRFGDLNYSQTISDFSLPLPLGERYNPLRSGSSTQAQLIQLISWLLQHRLLIQLHTYVYLQTYLDSRGTELSNGALMEALDDDGSLKLSVKNFEDDDNLSDTFSEHNPDSDAMRLVGTSPSQGSLSAEQELINMVNNTVFPPRPTSLIPNGGVKKRERELSGDADGSEDVSIKEEKYKGTLSELQDDVKRAIALVKNPISVQDIKMFSRLSKYFSGEFHLEEIMYRENIRRSQLMLLLDKFRDVVITVEKEDAGINFFKLGS